MSLTLAWISLGVVNIMNTGAPRDLCSVWEIKDGAEIRTASEV